MRPLLADRCCTRAAASSVALAVGILLLAPAVRAQEDGGLLTDKRGGLRTPPTTRVGVPAHADYGIIIRPARLPGDKRVPQQWTTAPSQVDRAPLWLRLYRWTTGWMPRSGSMSRFRQ